MDGRTVGCLGGGQLGRMMAEAGHRLGIRMAILDPLGSSSPAGLICDLAIEGSFHDANKIKELAAVCDLITVEIEHVDTAILYELVASGYTVHPHPSVISIIQDKYQQKEFLRSKDIPLPEYRDTPTVEDVYAAAAELGLPLMLKNKRLAYDGRGNAVVKDISDIQDAFTKLGGKDIYAEKWCPFVKELAVMVVKSREGVVSYPVVETIQKNSVCDMVVAPAQVATHVLDAAMEVAKNAIASFDGLGIFGVELFLLPDDTVLLNEIAPRPHNSGHYTMEACDIDQFEMHLRCVLGLPCPVPTMRVNVALMKNILGEASMEETVSLCKRALEVSGAGVHWYGKSESRPGRKMAHITLTADSPGALRAKADILGLDLSHGLSVGDVRVGIIMGSDSDLSTMKEAADILDEFQVPYEITIVSAHRTPSRMYSYAQSAAERGLQVIIAGAGGAAHLPGMVAALTSLPVVGVPVKSSALSGNDSLLSIVQMPKGIPVATVAIGNAANAALLAVRIMGASDKQLLQKMDAYMARQEGEVLRKAVILETLGHKEYLKTYFK